MISDDKFPAMQNFMTNFGAITGGAMILAMDKAFEPLGATLGGIEQALTGEKVDLAKEVKPSLNEAMLEFVSEVRSGGPSEEEIKKARERLTDDHVNELEALLARHDTGLPPLTRKLSDEELVAWIATANVETGPIGELTGELRQWLGGVFALLDDGNE